MPEALQIVKPDSGLAVTPELIEGFLETLAERRKTPNTLKT